MGEVMEVHPDLMRPAAVQRAFQQAHPRAGPQDAIFGLRRPPLPARDAHPLPMDRVPGDGLSITPLDFLRMPATSAR